jgi:hypothetical protein
MRTSDLEAQRIVSERCKLECYNEGKGYVRIFSGLEDQQLTKVILDGDIRRGLALQIRLVGREILKAPLSRTAENVHKLSLNLILLVEKDAM